MILGITYGILKTLIKSMYIYMVTKMFLGSLFLDTLIHQLPNSF